MTTDQILQLVLRLLPSLIVLVLGFVAATDAKTRERWSGLLYQMGSLRPEQRDDPAVQRGVRVPFFLVSALLLIWPVQYYRHATKVFEISPTAYGSRKPNFNPYGGQSGAKPTTETNTSATGNAVQTTNSAPYGSATAAPATTPTFSPYGNSTSR
jgi:hypothetical protein